MDIQFQGQTIRVPDGATDAQIQAILSEVMKQGAGAPATTAATVNGAPARADVLPPGAAPGIDAAISYGSQPRPAAWNDFSHLSMGLPSGGGGAPAVGEDAQPAERPGGAYQPGGGGWLTDAIWGSYSLAPGLGPLAAYFWQQGMTPRDAARMIGQGATLSSSDELLAGAKAYLDEGLDYPTALAQERQADSAIREEFPVTSAVAQTAGAVGVGALTGAGLGALGVTAPASTIGRVLVGGATGAAAGGIDAFNSGEGGFHPRMEQVLPGAMVGGVFGMGFPLATKLGGMAWNRLRGPVSGAYDDALRIINSRLRSDEVTPADAGRRLTELGPEGMIVDTGGPNTLRLGGSTYRAPGEGATIAKTALRARRAGQGARIFEGFNDTYSAARTIPDYFDAGDALRTQRATEAKPLYETAFARGTAVTDTRIDQFLADPIVRRGLNAGLEIQRLEALAEGKPFNPTEYGITGFNEAGDPIIGTVPNFRLLDAGKRGLDAIIEDARDPVTGRIVWTERLRAVDAVRRAYVARLDQLNPAYKAAREAWAGPSAALDAMAMGRRLINEDDRTIARVLADMSPSEREFFQVGVKDAIRRVITQTPDGADVVKRIFGTPWKRSAIEALFNDPAQFQAFQRQMEAEARFWEVQTELMAGSQTAERGAADTANGVPNFGDSVGGGLMMDAATGQFPGTMGTVRMFLDTLLSDAPRATPATYEQIARILFNKSPAENAAALEALRRAGILGRGEQALMLGTNTGAAGGLSGEILPQRRGLTGMVP